ncbi:protein IWS1 homolog A-like [Anopheles aquasalis]|uniref:protein IWS1 homolog A-like n=1 Tax=Anopheles aquasalis TaxID=42839 RepID=UPI00215AB6AD|nr:protein IWS1 homolog A-like [Anopheles aquasalis]
MTPTPVFDEVYETIPLGYGEDTLDNCTVGEENGEFVSDFDAMLARKKQERKRAAKGTIPTVDIPKLFGQMMEAAFEDRKRLRAGQLPTRKLLLLDSAMSQLMKKGLHQLYLGHGLLSIREAILKVLQLYDCIRTSQLKQSGLGEQIYRIAKDPQELQKNRMLAQALVTKWARDVFGISDDYRSMTRAERIEHDMKAVPEHLRKGWEEQQTADHTIKAPFVQLVDAPFVTVNRTVSSSPAATTLRARVPMVSTKEYIIRPASKLADDGPHHQPMATMMGRCERMMRNYNKKRGM